MSCGVWICVGAPRNFKRKIEDKTGTKTEVVGASTLACPLQIWRIVAAVDCSNQMLPESAMTDTAQQDTDD